MMSPSALAVLRLITNSNLVQQSRRNRQGEGLGGFEVDHELELGERGPVRPAASGRIRAMEYRVYRLLETSYAT